MSMSRPRTAGTQSLGVVLITRNQEWNVRRLLRSVLDETRGHSPIVFVDSASSDRTAERASEFPVEVLRLASDQRLTAAAGRAVGLSRLTTDLVLFLDGDMELRAGWLRDALRVLRERPEVAVVSGQVVDLPTNVSLSTRLAPAVSGRAAETAVKHGGGAALYRRQALDQVGSFNADLFSEEEPELCLRLRAAGYQVVRLERPMVSHYTEPAHAISSLFSRRRRNLYLGAGQVLRLHHSTPLGWTYLHERGFALPALSGIVATLLAIVASLAARDARPLLAWLTLVLLVLAADAVRKRSVYRTLHSLLVRTLFLEGVIRGYRLGAATHGPMPRFEVISSAQPKSLARQRGPILTKGAVL